MQSNCYQSIRNHIPHTAFWLRMDFNQKSLKNLYKSLFKMYIKVSIKISIKVSIKNLYKSLSKVERNQTSYTRHSSCGRILIKRERDGKNLKLVAWCFLSTPQVRTRRRERKQCFLSPANTNASKVQTNKTKREKHSATSDNVSSHLQI